MSYIIRSLDELYVSEFARDKLKFKLDIQDSIVSDNRYGMYCMAQSIDYRFVRMGIRRRCEVLEVNISPLGIITII